MTIRADVDGSLYLANDRFKIKYHADGEGAQTHKSVLNVGIAAGVDSGGGTSGAILTGTWDDDTFVVGERVTFYHPNPTYGGTPVVGGLVSAEAANSVTITGADTNFPTNGVNGVIVKDTSITTEFEGDDLECFAAYCDAAATVTFWDADVSKLAIDLTAGQSYYWMKDTGYTNPLAGFSIDEVSFVMYDADGDEVVKFGLTIDNA